MGRTRFWLSAAVWVVALAIAVVVAGGAIVWALLAVTGLVAMAMGVVLVAGGARRPMIGWPLIIAGVAVGIFGIARLALAL